MYIWCDLCCTKTFLQGQLHGNKRGFEPIQLVEPLVNIPDDI